MKLASCFFIGTNLEMNAENIATRKSYDNINFNKSFFNKK